MIGHVYAQNRKKGALKKRLSNVKIGGWVSGGVDGNALIESASFRLFFSARVSKVLSKCPHVLGFRTCRLLT